MGNMLTREGRKLFGRRSCAGCRCSTFGELLAGASWMEEDARLEAVVLEKYLKSISPAVL